jgi:hypothetical protein
MDQQQQSRRPTRSWSSRWYSRIAALVSLEFLIIVIGSYLFEWKWTGFADRTMWDWLTLLLPAYIAAIGTYFGARLTSQQSSIQQEVEERRARDTAVQTYVDQTMSLLANEVPRDSHRGEELRVLLRARARMVFDRIGATDKTSVLRFLHDAGLILGEQPTVHLEGADLSGAVLGGMDLRETNLSGANLSGANLRGAYLDETDLREANLEGAHLDGANLQRADLSNARLKGVTGLTSGQIEWTIGSGETELPEYLVDHRPSAWRKQIFEQMEIIEKRLKQEPTKDE